MSEATVVDRQEASAMIERLRDESELCANEGADDISDLLDEATETIERLTDALTAKDEHASAMRKAIVQAVEVIQVWHNMGMSGKVASDAWDIYWRNAPEMKPIREALKEA